MRRILAIVVTLAFAMTSVAVAAPVAGKGKNKDANTSTLSGTVIGYQEHKKNKQLVISVANDDGKLIEQSVRLDDSTKVTLDGNPIAASALRAGEKVTITLAKKTATQVTATSN